MLAILAFMVLIGGVVFTLGRILFPDFPQPRLAIGVVVLMTIVGGFAIYDTSNAPPTEVEEAQTE